MCIAPPLSTLSSYTVLMDAAPGPDTSDNNLRLILVHDPVVMQIRNLVISGTDNDSRSTTIEVSIALKLYSNYHFSFH